MSFSKLSYWWTNFCLNSLGGHRLTLYQLCCMLLILFVTILLLLLLLMFVEMSIGCPQVLRYRIQEEMVFFDQDYAPCRFPSLADEPTKDLSVVVPAYNKKHLLRPMLDSCLEWLINVKQSNFEVIVVNDASTDGTFYVVEEYVRKYGSDRIRLLSLMENRGKGGALSLGMLSARGRNLLFFDIESATKFEDIEKLYSALDNLTENAVATRNESDNTAEICAVVCGSQINLETTLFTFIMTPLHILFWMFGIPSIKDTQCGFKLFTRSAARIIFNNLHLERWGFDIEMLFIAEKLDMNLAEVAVTRTEIEEIKPGCIWIDKGFAVMELLAIWFKYCSGTWKIHY